MKNRRRIFITLLLVFIFTLSIPFQIAATYNGNPGDGADAEEPEKTDSAPDISRLYYTPSDMIIYIPVRPLIEKLGGIVEWNGADGSILIVTPDGRKTEHVPGTKTICIDGIKTAAALPSVLQNGVTYFPVPLLKQLLGQSAEYDAATNAVAIASPDPETIKTVQLLKSCSGLSFYLPENLLRYMDYITLHPETELTRATAYVNAGADKPFFSDIRETSDPESILVLCTKNNILPSDYVPEDLVYISGTSHRLRREAAEQYEKMRQEAVSEGCRFTVYSGYRSYYTQQILYERYSNTDGTDGADEYSARPGHSEHQAGLAIDISAGVSEEDLSQTETYRWLTENAHRFGFILRYPDGYSDITGYQYEPWHWRYIGTEAALVMYEEQIPTFEEYCGKYLADRLA
jgi:D-alanyl-D-alanine carboxypeptidase